MLCDQHSCLNRVIFLRLGLDMFLGVEELFSLSSKGYVYYSHLRSTALGGGKYGWEGGLHHIRHLTAKEFSLLHRQW